MKEMSARASQGFNLQQSETHQQASVFAAVLPADIEEKRSHRHAPLSYLFVVDVDKRNKIRKTMENEQADSK